MINRIILKCMYIFYEMIQEVYKLLIICSLKIDQNDYESINIVRIRTSECFWIFQHQF